jgi:hypothetical protein
MSVPRAVKLARRRLMMEPAPIDRPWLIDTLIPAIVIGLILWTCGMAGLLAATDLR